MEITETFIKDLFVINYNSFKDKRGDFVKTIHSETFQQAGLDYKFEECFYSISNKNVIRGMHFQIPPDDHSKLVYLVSGKIIDVVLDIRKNSKTFGNYFISELNSVQRQGLYIGKGLAHGFLSLSDNSIVEYHTTSAYSAINENGIDFKSFGYDWGVSVPIISERDLSFLSFTDFNSPF